MKLFWSFSHWSRTEEMMISLSLVSSNIPQQIINLIPPFSSYVPFNRFPDRCRIPPCRYLCWQVWPYWHYQVPKRPVFKTVKYGLEKGPIRLFSVGRCSGFYTLFVIFAIQLGFEIRETYFQWLLVFGWVGTSCILYLKGLKHSMDFVHANRIPAKEFEPSGRGFKFFTSKSWSQ